MTTAPSLPSVSSVASNTTTPRRRFAVVGTGGRANVFIEPLATRFGNTNSLVAMCDTNPGRMEIYQRRLAAWGHEKVPTFDAADFSRMIRLTQPDAVIVCTPDHLHAKYIVTALEHGCDVVVEKPMAIDAPGCNEVLDAVKRTGRQVRVTFNCRYIPWAMRIKQLLLEGTIGQVIHAQVEWMLDARKGCTYFARWHAQKKLSGGLVVHKSSHHLDLVNWWLDAVPDSVFGLGQRAFFGAENRHKHGIGRNGAVGDCYMDHDNPGDPYALHGKSLDGMREMFLPTKDHDGYRPDRSVWRKDQMDIEDSFSLLVKYRTGASLSYTLNAFLPRRGASVILNGTRGRIEFHDEPGGSVEPNGVVERPTPPQDSQPVNWHTRLIVHPMFGEAYEFQLPRSEGGHEGSDPLMTQGLFGAVAHPDPLGCCAGAQQGAASTLIGAAANESFASGLPVRIADLCPSLSGAVHLSELS